jgi:transcriptional regulator with XRE-family HTH domain
VNASADKLRFDEGDLLDAIEERIRPLTAARLGRLLQDLRESSRLPLRDVALVPELRSELEGIEAGLLRPDAGLVEALLRCYDASIDDLVPPRGTLVVTEGSEKEVLTRYLVAVRRERGSGKHPRLREADLHVLAGILGTDSTDIQLRLQHHAIEERIAPLSSARLGVLVQRLRQSTRFARPQLARPAVLLQSQLEDVEAGRLRPDAALLEALLDYCEADLDHLVPPRDTLVVTEGTDKEVLTRYLAAMRRWRGRGKDAHLREADLHVLAGILGTDPRNIRRRLRKLTNCSRRRARRLTAMLLAGIAVAPAAATLLRNTGAPATATIQKNVVPSGTDATSAPVLTAAAVHPAAVHTTAATAKTAAATKTATTVQSAAIAKAAAIAKTAATTKTAATVQSAAAHTVAADCATALSYLAAHAKPGFAHYCRPGDLKVGISNAVAYTCVPGPTFACPDGNREIIIADPGCAATYENEASNSYWNFSTGAIIEPGATQDGRTWDPYGECT